MVQLNLEMPQDDTRKGMVKLTWCVPPDIAEELRGKTAYLFIVVQAIGKPNHVRHQRRQLVQLNAGATFISFRYSGENRVYAKIVFGSEKRNRPLLREEHLGFLDADGTDWAYTSASIGEALVERRARIAAIDAAIARLESAEKHGGVRTFGIDGIAADRVLIAYPNEDGSLSVGYCRKGKGEEKGDTSFRGVFTRLKPGEALASFAVPHHALVSDAVLPPEALKQPASAEVTVLRTERAQAEEEIAAYERERTDIGSQERMRGATDSFHVPEEAFGKKRPRIERYLSFWKHWRFADECNRRKCFWFLGVPVQPFVMFLNFLARVIMMLFAWMFGVIGFPYRKVYGLIDHDLKEMGDGWRAPFWIPFVDTPGGDERFVWWRLALVPFCPLILLIATGAVRSSGWCEGGFWRAILIAIPCIYGVMTVIAALIWAFVSWESAWDWISRFMNPLRWARIFLSGGSPMIDEDDLETLVCDGDCPDAKPKKHRRTLLLSFLRAKADHCRPLQG